MLSSRAVAVTSLFAAVVLLGASAALAFNPSPYMHSHRMVNVGARRMNLYCTGTGSPTVILDTDQDSTTLSWRFVQPDIARRTRVCSYDAAGLGFSDPAPPPRDAAAYTRDLRILLTHAHVDGPYILVGDKFSGLSARLFADRYPRDVAAMVLVDPLVPDRNKRLAALVPILTPLADQYGFISELQMCRAAAVNGNLHRGTRAFNACMWPTGPTDPSLPKAVRVELQKQWERPSAWDDLIFAARAQDESSAEVRREQRGYGSMPLIVLSSDVRIDLKGMPLSNAQIAKISMAYQSWHRSVAALSSRGAEFVVEGSRDIAVDHPSNVISAITEVLWQVRNKSMPFGHALR